MSETMSQTDLLELAIAADLHGIEPARWQQAVGVRPLTDAEHAARAAYFDRRIAELLGQYFRRRHILARLRGGSLAQFANSPDWRKR